MADCPSTSNVLLPTPRLAPALDSAVSLRENQGVSIKSIFLETEQLGLTLDVAPVDDQASLKQSLTVMTVMVDLGLPAEIITMPLTMHPRLTLEQYRYLLGPVVIHQSSWGNYSCPPWLKSIIFKERLAIVCDELDTGKTTKRASKAEVIMMLLPASQDGPLRSDDGECLFHCIADVFAKYRPDGVDLQAVIGTNPPAYSRVKHTLEPYAWQLREKVVKHAKARGVKLDRAKT